MNPILKNSLAFVLGAFAAMMLNGLLVQLGGRIIPPPEGTNLSTPEGIKAAMHLLQPKHFLFPFLAHALGSLVGALVVVLVAASYKLPLALGIAGFHMIGGVMMVFMVPAPLWFDMLDLGLAYLPMGWLAWRIAGGKKTIT
jgi:hypothetical protein